MPGVFFSRYLVFHIAVACNWNEKRGTLSACQFILVFSREIVKLSSLCAKFLVGLRGVSGMAVDYKNIDFKVRTLGEPKIPSPLNLSAVHEEERAGFVSDKTRIIYNIEENPDAAVKERITLEKAGPREKIFFRPGYSKAAIVTCGGISPGLNNVIRSLFMQLYYRYGVKDIYGFRFGYKGFDPANGFDPIKLTPEIVEPIHRTPGTFLGSSRGMVTPEIIVERLEQEGIDMLFAIGGDGTLRGAHSIWLEVERRGLEIAVVGVPKTIDNDINFVDKTFGFDSAVEEARRVLESAHAEAQSAINGIGLVKVMGRDAGFIAAHATLASREVNFCLIPEIPFDLYGEHGFLAALEKRLMQRHHAVIVVAEGAGQDLMGGPLQEKDASGNIKYKDIGLFLKEKIIRYFEKKKIPINLKYIDPSYSIRSVLPNANDSIFCDHLSRYAVHAAMAGKTDLIIGLCHGYFTHIPIEVAVAERKRIHPDSTLWFSVVEATGQPRSMVADHNDQEKVGLNKEINH